MSRLKVALSLFAVVLLAPLFADAGTTTWPQMTIRGLIFQADRGTVSDSIVTLSGDTISVVVRRKWMTSSNATIRAYPAFYTGADTLNQGTDATYLGSNWWALDGVAWAPYNFYEIEGGADSLITNISGLVAIGNTLPDSSVVRASIRNAAVGADEIDATADVSLNSLTVTDSIYAANKIRMGGSDTDSLIDVGYLQVNYQLDTPDIRCFLADSILVANKMHFIQGYQTADTSYIGYHGAALGGVLAIYEPDGQYAIYMKNSGVGAFHTIDFAAPNFFTASLGTSSSKGLLLMNDGSSNTLTISVDPLASNLAMHIDADTVATGDILVATVSGSTITLRPKQRFIGQVSYTENTNTWEYFVISGMDAATDYSWIVHLTMQDYPTTAMRSFAGYAIHDTLAVIVPAAFTTDYILNYTIQEP